MNAHLTNQELTDRLLGDRSMTIDAHLLDCAECRKELHQLRDSIGLFRGAVHAWSEDVAVVRSRRPVRGRPRTMSRWVMAAAALVLLVVLPALFVSSRRYQAWVQTLMAPTAIAATQTQIDQDNQLLSEVNSEIAEGVPAPMQPLRVSYGASAPTSQVK